MKTLITALVLTLSTLVASSATALTPGFSVREGYIVVLKDGGTPGPVGTRYDLTLTEKVSEGVMVTGGLGLASPNATFTPSLRATASLGLALVGPWSAHTGLLYQRNIGYGGKPSTNSVGWLAGPTYLVTKGVTLSISLGVGKTLDGGDWTFLFQPSLGFSFF